MFILFYLFAFIFSLAMGVPQLQTSFCSLMNITDTDPSNDVGKFRFCMDYKNANWRKEYYNILPEYIYLEIFNGTTDTKYHIPLDSYDCDET